MSQHWISDGLLGYYPNNIDALIDSNSFTSFIHNTARLDISYSAVWLLLQGLMYHWRQNYFVATIIILSRLDKSFVSTSILLLRQKTCFVATNTCKSLHAAKPHPRRVHQCSVSFLAVLRPPALLAEWLDSGFFLLLRQHRGGRETAYKRRNNFIETAQRRRRRKALPPLIPGLSRTTTGRSITTQSELLQLQLIHNQLPSCMTGRHRLAAIGQSTQADLTHRAFSS